MYRIAGKFQEEERVPPEAIIGAWKVDNRGCIVDGFARNENYDSQRWPFVLNKGTEGGMREGESGMRRGQI